VARLFYVEEKVEKSMKKNGYFAVVLIIALIAMIILLGRSSSRKSTDSIASSEAIDTLNTSSAKTVVSATNAESTHVGPRRAKGFVLNTTIEGQSK
jgi:hypothetical protein